MIDDSCEVPREDLDDGFNPCRKQVVENGELEAYAHMYDVMNERYDREEDTSYLNSVKRDRITQTTPSQAVGEGKLYAQDGQGVEGFIKSSGTLDPTTHAEIPSSKAVADYAPIPLPISKGGTGGNTPYMTDDLDNSAIFVMHDAPNDRYDAAPMSALTNYLATQFMSFDNEAIPDGADLNTYKKPGNYATRTGGIVPTIINAPNNVSQAFNLYVVPTLDGSSFISQYLVEYMSGNTYYRDYRVSSSNWNSWKLLYPTPSSTVPNPLPVSLGGTGVNARNYIAPASSLGILMTSNGSTGDISNWTTVDALAGYVNTIKTQPEIAAAFANHTADAVANNDLLPTNALMIDYVDAHSMETPPDKLSFSVSPFPTGNWVGEMTINVVPVFATTIGRVSYVVARVYGSKKFGYTGSEDNVNLFSSLKLVGEYPDIFNASTNIPLTLSVSGRSYTSGTYGFTPNGNAANLSLNNQVVSSVFNLGNFNISNNLKCVFGEGTNTPGVTVTVNSIALMWV